MRQEHSVEIAAPPAEVFAYATADENAPKWAEGIESIETLHEAPGRVGSRFRMRIREGGRVNVYEGTVEAWEQDRFTRDRVERGGMAMTMEMRYEPTASGTRVTQTVDVPLKGAMALMTPVVWLMNRHFQRKQMAKLKELLEQSAR